MAGGGSVAAMPAIGPLAAHREKRPCAGVSYGSGQRTSFGEHVTQVPRAGRSAPVRSATAWVRGTLLSEASELIWVCRDFAMLDRLPLAGDVASRLSSPVLRSAELVKKRVAKALPALRLLQRRQLLWLAEQTAGTALLGATSLVVGHDRKLSADTVPQARPRLGRCEHSSQASIKPALCLARRKLMERSLGSNNEQSLRKCVGAA